MRRAMMQRPATSCEILANETRETLESVPLTANNKQLLDEVEQNIVICQWRAVSYLPMPSSAEANNG
jgi:hypothetical protein